MCSLEEAWSSEEFKNLETEDCDPNYFCLPHDYFQNPHGLEKNESVMNVQEEEISNYNFNDDLLETNAIVNENIKSENKSNNELNNEKENTNIMNNVVEEESFLLNNNEGFTNNNNYNLNNNKDIKNTLTLILERIENIENNMKKNNNSNNNVHDVILFIIIGVFILFALDSIFKIGKMTI